MELTTIKQHLRILDSYDDELLSKYTKWAEDEVRKSIDSISVDDDFLKDNLQYEKAVVLLVTHFYENRKPTTDRPQYNIIRGFDHAIYKLKLDYQIYKAGENNGL